MNHWKKPFKTLLLALAVCLLLGAGALAAEEEAETTTVYGFTDIAGTEYESDITVMYTMGLAVGYSDNTFRPGRAYTRLEAAELVVDLLGLNVPEDYENPYFDADGIAGSEAIAAAVAGGFMTGRSADSFDPYGSMLKAELMSVLAKIAESLGTKDLITKLDEDLALWAEDYTIITAAEAMHAARGMIMSLEAKLTEEEAAEEEEIPEAASGEPSGEIPADEEAEESTVTAAEEAEAVDESETTEETEAPAEEAVTEESAEDAEAPAEEAEEAPETASGKPSAEMGENAASAEASAEMSAPAAPEAPAEAEEAPAAPQGVLTPVPEAQTPAAPTVPEAPAVQTVEVPTVPEAPQATQMPEIDPDDPGAQMKTTVYSFYANIRDQLVSFFSDLLG